MTDILHAETPTMTDAVMMPRWWTGTPAVDPARYVIDAGGTIDQADLADLGARMRDTFDEVGLVHVITTGLRDHSDMRAVAKLVVDAEMDYRGGANPRASLEPNVYEIGAPLSAALHYHHEMAYVGTSTEMVAFLAKATVANDTVPGRGATFVSDNVAATDAILATDFGQKLAEVGVCYHRDLTDRDAFTGREPIGVYNHWQQSFGTDNPAEAEARARAKGLRTSWGPDRTLQTRYDAPAFEYHPGLDRNLLFASVADHAMWFDSWPLVEHLPPRERPLWMTFGDGTDFTTDDLQTFVDVYDRFGSPIDWQVGDVAVICNYRFAHGRPAIDLVPGEERELGVLLGRSFDRVGPRPDAW